VKLVIEVIGGETHAIGSQFLIDARVNRPALFGRQRGVSRKTRIITERLIESRFDDSLPVRGV
jgi:hypothetical protein